MNCKLTLLKSSVRTTPVLDGDYVQEGAEDGRFSDYFGTLQSIVTSSAQNDGGLFETNLRDERYLPFENSGVIGEWRLELPADPSKDDPRQFDYATVSDVILHIRYTAREGGELLRRAALKHLRTAIENAEAAGSVRLFAVRHEFPAEWARFQSQTPDDNQRHELRLTFRPEHYPFWSQRRLTHVERVDLLARSTATGSIQVAHPNDATATVTLARDSALGNLLVGKLANNGLPTNPVGELKRLIDTKALSDLWIAVTWGK